MIYTLQHVLLWTLLKSISIGRLLHTVNADQEGCQTVSSLSNYILQGHVLSSIYGQSFDTCIGSCENNKLCLSINYLRRTRTCELNTRNKATNACDLIARDGGLYMDSLHHLVRDACALHPCRNGGSCVVMSSCRGFRCECGEFYKGSMCEDCTSLGAPLGMESRDIPDNALTASSYMPDYPASNGRLGAEGWVAQLNDTANPYFQVQLNNTKYVSRVCLQGVNITSPHYRGGAWIRQLYFSHSLNGINWIDYYYNRFDKYFKGNNGVNDKRFFNFTAPIRAKYVRVIPSIFENRPAARIELYGCEIN